MHRCICVRASQKRLREWLHQIFYNTWKTNNNLYSIFSIQGKGSGSDSSKSKCIYITKRMNTSLLSKHIGFTTLFEIRLVIAELSLWRHNTIIQGG